MFFRENKRLKSKKDKETLERLKRAIFDNTIPVSTTINKNFKTIQELKTKYNLANKNSTCPTVNKSEPYEEGETRVCRSWFKVKQQVLIVNYEHNITAVEWI